MLVIGHRGSRGTAHENTVDSLLDAITAGADMIEFDVRLTSDNIPVLAHDTRIHGTRRRELAFVRRFTLRELKKRAKAKGYKLATLDEALEAVLGKIYLNIELKEVRSVAPTMDIIRKHAKTPEELDSILFSSFNPLTLRRLRNEDKLLALGLLHHRNPLTFVGWHRLLNLSAVGFHRLHVNDIALEIARKFGLFTYVYTVNRPEAARRLENKGLEAVVTDFPEKMVKELNS